MLSSNGYFITLNLSDIHLIQSIGTMTIISQLTTQDLHSTRDVELVQQFYHQKTVNLKLCMSVSCTNYCVVVSVNGSIKLINLSKTVGYSGATIDGGVVAPGCGYALRSRPPYKQDVKRIDAIKSSKQPRMSSRQSKTKKADGFKDAGASAKPRQVAGVDNVLRRALGQSLGKENVSLEDLSLFQLSTLTEPEKRINNFKLKAFYDKNGEFPSKYRSLIW